MRFRRVVRYIWFVVSIALGTLAGLLIGWSIPVENASPGADSLRQDYQADYVLMVAEVFNHDGDLAAANQRLQLLGVEDTTRFVQQATINAQNYGYSPADLQMMAVLSQALSLSTTNAPEEIP